MTVDRVVARVLRAEMAGDPAVGQGAPGSTAPPRPAVIAAVSGGLDSTGLAHCLAGYCRESGIRLIACHFNHMLRSEESHARDVEAVRATCRTLDVPLVTGTAGAHAIRSSAARAGSGVEAAARVYRYEFYRRAAVATGAKTICTGHTEDDQVETVFMALQRGVDPIGLAGIPARRVLDDGMVLLRPLLTVRRSDIEALLTERGAAWRDDPTNLDLGYSRNRARHVLLPELERDDGEARATLLALQREAARSRASAESGLIAWAGDGDDRHVSVESFLSASRGARLMSLFAEARRRGMVRPASRISVRFFAPLLGESIRGGTLIRSRGSHIERSGGELHWSPDIVRGREYGYLRSVTLGVAVDLPADRTLTVYSGKKEITDNHASVIELNQVHLPLMVRSRRAGDELPTGRGRQSVAALLAEHGVPRAERDLVPIVADRAGILAILSGHLAAGGDVLASRSETGGEVCTLMFKKRVCGVISDV